jgi:hypothetical protein
MMKYMTRMGRKTGMESIGKNVPTNAMNIDFVVRYLMIIKKRQGGIRRQK